MSASFELKVIRPRLRPNLTLLQEVQKQLNGWAAELIGAGRRYPPQPPSSRYERRGRYGRGWTSRRITDGISVRNPVPYAPFVGGPWQVAVHARTGWADMPRTAEQLWRNRYEQRITRLLEAAIIVTPGR